jgi:pyridoxal phosphate enzyme (YggS family)
MSRAAEIASNLKDVHERIQRALAEARRDPSSVSLLAVSKTVAPEDIVMALTQGQVDFAENYGQEFRDKHAAVASLTAAQPPPLPIRWHFIGPLQSNKVKYVVGKTSLIHTVADLAVLAEIERKAAGLSLVQSCLIQVNVAGETQKSGLAPQALPAMLDAFAQHPHCRCLGLMVIPPYDPDPERSRPHFDSLRRLRDAERVPVRSNVDLQHLSMGMSHDMEMAIACGATLLRVGTAIFGART